MGKHQNSVVVFQIGPKFWCMIFMGMKDNHTKIEQELSGGGRERALQVVDLGFQICQKYSQKCPLWATLGD